MIRRQFGLWVLKTLSACQLLNLPLFGCLPPPTMANLILMSLRSLLTGFRNRAAMHAEIIALRQLIVLQRTQKTKRLILGPCDRCLWVWLSHLSGYHARETHYSPQNRDNRVFGWYAIGQHPQFSHCRTSFRRIEIWKIIRLLSVANTKNLRDFSSPPVCHKELLRRDRSKGVLTSPSFVADTFCRSRVALSHQMNCCDDTHAMLASGSAARPETAEASWPTVFLRDGDWRCEPGPCL